MMDWADWQAETIVDAFLSYQRTNDLVLLQRTIAAALCRAKEAKLVSPPMMLFRDNG